MVEELQRSDPQSSRSGCLQSKPDVAKCWHSRAASTCNFGCRHWRVLSSIAAGSRRVDVQQVQCCNAAGWPQCDTDSIFGPRTRWGYRRPGNWISGASSAAGSNLPDGAYLASIASYDDVLVSLLGDVTAAYIGIRTTERLIAVARDNIIKQEQALAIAKARYQGGGTSERDQFQAQNVLGATQSAIPQLTIQLEQLKNALCVLLGIPPQSLEAALGRMRGRIPIPPSTVAVGIPADLLRRRPDVRTAELAALAQSAQIGVAESELYPAISISGAFGGSASTANGHNLGQVFASKGMTYAVGPSFRWNILNYGQITNNVRLQDAKLQQLLIDYQSTVLVAQQQVDNGLVNFLQSQLQVRYLRSSAEAADGALKLALDQYEQGATDFTTVLTAEAESFQGAKRPRGGFGQYCSGSHSCLSSAGRRVANSQGWSICESGHARSNARAYELG